MMGLAALSRPAPRRGPRSAALLLVLLTAVGTTSFATTGGGLELLEAGAPRAFVFRQAEALVQRLPYEEWEAKVGRLGGIVGKLVVEERGDVVSDRTRDYFRRFKQEHPTQLVLLHLDGVGWLPRFDPAFGPQHWLYTTPTALAKPLPRTGVRAVLEDPTSVRVALGRSRVSAADALLVGRDLGGELDWSRTEQVRVVALSGVEASLERGAYGTEPRAFEAGAWLAPHVTLGPFCPGCDPLWLINFSTAAPRDAEGRSGGDRFVERIVRLLSPEGPAAFVDGVQLDAFFFEPLLARFVDVDLDGRADGGRLEGRQTYGLGGVEALAALRARLGDRFLLIDGGAPFQRAPLSLIHGIEIEGFGASLTDTTARDWFSRLQLLELAGRESRSPALSYVNHKFLPELAFPIDYRAFRLVLAGTVLSGSLFTNFIEPGGGSLRFYPNRPGEPVGVFSDELAIFDELVAGTEGRRSWLGHPRGPLLFPASGARVVASSKPRVVDGAVEIDLPAFETLSSGGLLWIDLAAAAGATLPFGLSRQASLRTADGEEIGSGWVDPVASSFRFLLEGPAAASEPLVLWIEGEEAVEVGSVRWLAGGGLVLREFEHGLVVANPTSRKQTVLLPATPAGTSWARLRGTPEQDPVTNDGRVEEGTMQLPARDAIFLRRVVRPERQGEAP